MEIEFATKFILYILFHMLLCVDVESAERFLDIQMLPFVT